MSTQRPVNEHDYLVDVDIGGKRYWLSQHVEFARYMLTRSNDEEYKRNRARLRERIAARCAAEELAAQETEWLAGDAQREVDLTYARAFVEEFGHLFPEEVDCGPAV